MFSDFRASIFKLKKPFERSVDIFNRLWFCVCNVYLRFAMFRNFEVLKRLKLGAVGL